MKTFQQKSMLVKFSAGIGFSCRKNDKQKTKEVARQEGVSTDDLDVMKRLLPKGCLDAWQAAIDAARDEHEKLALQWRDDGYRILRADKYLEYTAAMRKHRAIVEAERDKFRDLYPQIREQAPSRLNGMFDPKDFPPVDKLLSRYKFKTDVMPVPDGDDFRVDLADEEVAEIRRQIDADNRANAIRPLLKPVRNMVNRLKEPEGTFRDTLVSNIEDILKLMPPGDPEIDELIQRARESLIVSPEILRNSPSTRQQTMSAANEILATMSAYMVGAGETPPAPVEAPPVTAPLLDVPAGLPSPSAICHPEPVPAPPPPPPLPVAILPPTTPNPQPAAPPWRRNFMNRVAATANLL